MAEGPGGGTEDGAEGEHGGGFRIWSISTEGDQLEAAPQVSPYEEQEVSGVRYEVDVWLQRFSRAAIANVGRSFCIAGRPRPL